MFFPVHVATGALVDKASGKGRWRKWLLVAPLAFLTHPLLDYFNGGESGSSHVLFHTLDGVLVPVVISLSVVLGLLLVYVARRYWVGMLFACLPDVEWGIFMLTGWDKTQGLHGKLFWHPVFASEWGLLVQLGLFALVAGIVLLPRAQFSWGQAWSDARARVKLPEAPLQRVAEYSLIIPFVLPQRLLVVLQDVLKGK